MDEPHEPDNESPLNGGFRIRERSDSLAEYDEEELLDTTDVDHI